MLLHFRCFVSACSFPISVFCLGFHIFFFVYFWLLKYTKNIAKINKDVQAQKILNLSKFGIVLNVLFYTFNRRQQFLHSFSLFVLVEANTNPDPTFHWTQ